MRVIARKISGLTALVLLVLICGCRQAEIKQERSEAGRNLTDKSQDEFSEFLAGYVADQVSQATGLKVRRINKTAGESIDLVAAKDNGEGILMIKIKELKIYSPDILSKPLEVDLSLELMVLNAQKNEIYYRAVTGRHKAKFETFLDLGAVKKLAGIAAKDALLQYTKDPDLKKIVSKIKYGSWGGVAGIF